MTSSYLRLDIRVGMDPDQEKSPFLCWYLRGENLRKGFEKKAIFPVCFQFFTHINAARDWMLPQSLWKLFAEPLCCFIQSPCVYFMMHSENYCCITWRSSCLNCYPGCTPNTLMFELRLLILKQPISTSLSISLLCLSTSDDLIVLLTVSFFLSLYCKSKWFIVNLFLFWHQFCSFDPKIQRLLSVLLFLSLSAADDGSLLLIVASRFLLL